MEPARRAAASALLAALLAFAAPGCASDTPTRPDSARPAELDAMRETLADRREATRDLMETNLVRPSAPSAASTWGSGILDFLGRASGTALDVLSMRAFGLW